MNTPRTLIVGLDGATFELIDPLVQAGYLPTLGSLMAHGVRGPLLAWPNMNSASSWSSMVTGYNPGEHGVYNFGQEWDVLPQRGHKWHPTTGADRKRDPFWRAVSTAGQRVGIINVPMSYPADRISGFMLAGMDTPSVDSPGFAHPPGVHEELRRQGIDYVVDILNLSVLSQREPHRLPEQVRSMVDARSRSILQLMQTRPWDVLMAVFVATDRVQHYYWPDQRADVDNSTWAPVRTLYQQIDAFLADVLALLDENTTILLVSDHGFRPRCPATRCLNPLLARLGLLSYRRGAGDWKGGFFRGLLHQGRRIIPYRLQDPLARVFPRLHLQVVTARKSSRIAWSQTQVFAISYMGQVFVNLRGREPEGVVPPGEYDSLRERVSDILLSLVDPVSGCRVVKGVYRREELYHGPYFESAPDLVIDWDFSVLADSLSYPVGQEPLTIDPPKRTGMGQHWKGSHHPEGILIAHGPHIKRGATLTNARVYDVAPTILYLQNHLVPEDMDGRVLTDIFVKEHVQRNPVKLAKPASTELQTKVAVLRPEEERIVEERLRDLGYIE